MYFYVTIVLLLIKVLFQAEHVLSDVPNPPENLTLISKSSRSVNISWSDGNNDTEDYKVNIKSKGITVTDILCDHRDGCNVTAKRVFIKGLNPFTEYQITVLARNDVGLSNKSSQLNFTTNEEEPGKPPGNVRGHNFSSISILVQWDGVPQADQNGIITGYRVKYRTQNAGGEGISKQVNKSRNKELLLGGLNTSTSYNICVLAFTVKGDGPQNCIVVKTAVMAPRTVTCNQGKNVAIICNVSSEGIELKWLFMNRPVTKNSTKLSQTLLVNATKKYEGTYTCQNSKKTESMSMSLKVNGSSTSTCKGTCSPDLQNQGTSMSWEIIGPLAALGLICPIVIFAVWFLRRRNKNASATTESPPEGAPTVPVRRRRPSDPWEVLEEDVFIQGFLGVGAFGEVWRAVVQHVGGIKGNRECAVKKLRGCVSSDNRKKFMKEIEIMKMLGKHKHPNIIRFRGCVTRSEPLMIIMEYTAFGDLLGFMRKSRGVADKHHNAEDLQVRELTNYDLVKFSHQIACGMQFLKAKGIMHRDLAARNVLVTTKFICKITDFGMAFQTERYGYGTAKRGRIPIKWTAPEVLFETSAYQVSSKSDVWSYGIVLYEIFTLGGTPYDGFREADVMAQLQNKQYRMPQPSHVSDSIYEIMMQCWSEDPDSRPTFEELNDVFLDCMAGEYYLEVVDMAQYESILYQPEKFVSDDEDCDDPPVPDNPPVTNIPISPSVSETSLDVDVVSSPPTALKGFVSESDISIDPVPTKPRYVIGKALSVNVNNSLQNVRF